ncbi:MAG: hypothetical protein ACI9V8_001913, partial [Urechidicola sp.]
KRSQKHRASYGLAIGESQRGVKAHRQYLDGGKIEIQTVKV